MLMHLFSLRSRRSITRPRTVLIDSNTAPELYWMPYDRKLWELGHLLADVQRMKGLTSAWRLPLLMQSRVETVKKFFAG